MTPAPAVRLVQIGVADAQALTDGTLERPPGWHPDFPTADTVGAVHQLFAAHAAMGLDPAGSPWWLSVIVVDDQVVGDAGFHGPPPAEGPVEVEIGYQVVPPMRGRGIATRACALLVEHAWHHGADLVRADADPENLASRAVLRANGFRLGRDGDFVVGRPPGRT